MTVRSFRKFLLEGEPDVLFAEQVYMNDEWDIVKGKFVNKKNVENVEEDLSGNQKRIKIKELQKLLSNFDYWYSKSSDSRVYRKGKEQEDTIDKLVGEIGKDGLKLYRKYISTKESKETNGTDKYLRNLIPEMMKVKPQDNRVPLGESGTSHFSNGDLYSGHSFFPPTPKLKSFDEKHLDRVSKYGKVYQG